MNDSADMAAPVISIAGKDVTLPAITFDMTRRMAPLLGAMVPGASDLEVRQAVVQVLAIFLGREAAALETEITYRELSAVSRRWGEILQWVGLEIEAPAPGEATAAGSAPAA